MRFIESLSTSFRGEALASNPESRWLCNLRGHLGSASIFFRDKREQKIVRKDVGGDDKMKDVDGRERMKEVEACFLLFPSVQEDKIDCHSDAAIGRGKTRGIDVLGAGEKITRRKAS